MKETRVILIGLDLDLVDQIKSEENIKLLGVIDKKIKKKKE